MPTKNVSVGTTETKIVGKDPMREVLTVQNIDAAESVDVSDSNADAGIRLYPGESMTLYRSRGENPDARWNGIGTGALNIRVLEIYIRSPGERVRPSARGTARGGTGPSSKAGSTNGYTAPKGGGGGALFK